MLFDFVQQRLLADTQLSGRGLGIPIGAFQGAWISLASASAFDTSHKSLEACLAGRSIGLPRRFFRIDALYLRLQLVHNQVLIFVGILGREEVGWLW